MKTFICEPPKSRRAGVVQASQHFYHTVINSDEEDTTERLNATRLGRATTKRFQIDLSFFRFFFLLKTTICSRGTTENSKKKLKSEYRLFKFFSGGGGHPNMGAIWLGPAIFKWYFPNTPLPSTSRPPSLIKK